MVPAISALIGAALGGYQAKRRGGNRKDMAQFAAVFALIFAVIGMFVAIYLSRAIS